MISIKSTAIDRGVQFIEHIALSGSFVHPKSARHMPLASDFRFLQYQRDEPKAGAIAGGRRKLNIVENAPAKIGEFGFFGGRSDSRTVFSSNFLDTRPESPSRARPGKNINSDNHTPAAASEKIFSYCERRPGNLAVRLGQVGRKRVRNHAEL